MDRSTIYGKWLSTTYKSQDGYDTPLCNERTIQKFNSVNDFNLKCYADYQDFYLETRDAASIPSIRAKIVQFLLSDGVKNIPLSSTTKEILDAYFETRKQNAARKTFESIVSYLGGFFDFLCIKEIIPDIFDAEKYRAWAAECPEREDSAAQALTAEQVSEFRNHLIVGSTEHPEYMEFLYVFDMRYYTAFEKHQIKTLSLAENVDIQTNTISFGDETIQVPPEVVENIIALDKAKRLGNLLNIDQYIKNMRPILEEYDFENVRLKDIKETSRKCFFECPQCGRRFEAIVDNWCGRQFNENGKIWIVCRECGNG